MNCPIVSSHSIPFDRYLIKEVDDTNGSKNNYNDNVNVIFADKVILIDKQKISWLGTPNEMLKSNNPKIKDFIKSTNPKLFV